MNPSHLLAQVPLGNIGGIGNLGNPTAGNELGAFTGFISNIIGFLTIVAGLWFFFQIIIAGYRWISAAGEKQNVQEAQKRLQNALIGLVIVIGAYILTGIVGLVLGIEIFQIGPLIESLAP